MNWASVWNWLGTHGVRILIIILIAVILYVAVKKLLPPAIRHTMRTRHKTAMEAGVEDVQELEKQVNTLNRIFVGTSTVVIIVAAIFMILSDIGIDVTALIAGFGIAGLAVGFGAQSLVKDIIAGVFIIVENQYRVGDVVRIADVAGVVEEMNIRRTVLRDLDGIVHFVPNGEIRVASNFTREWSRVNLNISVAYGTDLDHAIAVLNRVGEEIAQDPQWSPLILKAPQFVRVDKFGDSGIELKILGDTKPIQQWAVMGELRKRVKKAFDEEGIEIPWPHIKMYFGDRSIYSSAADISARQNFTSEITKITENPDV